MTGTIIDVSQHQGAIQWERVGQAGISAAYIRATLGGAGLDTRFAANAANAAPHMLFSFYHLFRPETAGTAQAQHCLNSVLPFPFNMPLAVDVEAVQTDSPLPPDRYADELAAFVQTVATETGENPLIYTSASQWRRLVGSGHDDLFRQCPLWVAHYDVQTPTLPPVWTTYWLWQYTNGGSIDGITGPVDLNQIGTPP